MCFNDTYENYSQDNFFIDSFLYIDNNMSGIFSAFNHQDNFSFYPKQKELALDEKDEDGLPRFYSSDDISNILSEYPEIKKIFDKQRKILESSQHYYYMKNKRKHIIKRFSKEELNIGKKRGRKGKISNKATHGKENPDNIIRKLKQRYFKYILVFLNKILNLNSQQKLVKLNYMENISSLSRKKDLECLEMTLMELFSKNISKKYTSKPKTFNRDKINGILKRIPLNEKGHTIKFVLNMKYKDFINLFTKKKKIQDLIESNENCDESIDCNLIKESLFDITHFIKDEFIKKKKYDEEYFCLLLFYFYNSERYYNLKQIRKFKEKEKNKDGKTFGK